MERYVITKDGEVFADSPRKPGMGLPTSGWTLEWEAIKIFHRRYIDKAFFVPKLCNQCEKPPCVQVCPVGATYQTADGVVLVDRKWCIGCGYCIMACPYGMRFFHPVYHVAEKCNFCYHRINERNEARLRPGLSDGCEENRKYQRPADPVANIIMTQRVSVHKPEYGTNPQVYFIGLSEEVR